MTQKEMQERLRKKLLPVMDNTRLYRVEYEGGNYTIDKILVESWVDREKIYNVEYVCRCANEVWKQIKES